MRVILIRSAQRVQFNPCNTQSVQQFCQGKNRVPKVFVDRHPTSDLYIKWLEEEMKLKIDNPLADRVKKYDWSSIDTVSNDMYDELQWYGKTNFVKGL